MAEGWLRHLAGNRFESLSAGANPSDLIIGACGERRPRNSGRVDHIRELLLNRSPIAIGKMADMMDDANVGDRGN